MKIDDYFARKTDDELAKALQTKIDDFERFIDTTGRLAIVKESYEHAYNLKLGAVLTRSGPQGEIMRVSINEYRAFLNSAHITVANVRPQFKAEAATPDNKSQSECLLADAILDHYLDEGELEAELTKAPLDAMIFGEVFSSVLWNENGGEEIAVNASGAVEFGGAPETQLHNGFNVIRDVNSRNGDEFDWVIVRCHENKWTLAAQHPDHVEHILNKSSNAGLRNTDTIYQKVRGIQDLDSDTIEVYRFFHAAVKGVLPQGKQALMINGKMIIQEALTKNYKQLPLTRLACGQMDSTLLPYSHAWDILPICQATNVLMTAAVTNAIGLALSSVWTPPGAGNDLSMKQLGGGLTHIQSAQKPEPLALAANSPEIWNTMNQLNNRAQILMGQNAVSQGDLGQASGIKSGTALATMLAKAAQANTMLSQRWRKYCEDTSNLMLEVVQINAQSPLLISIAGTSKASSLKAFTSKDISSVRRFRAVTVNPMLSRPEGKLEVANNLLQQFPQDMNPAIYMNVVNTGRMEGLDNGTFDQNMALLAEAEAIRQGKEIMPLLLERHDKFIKEDLKLIATPEAKEDGGLVDRVSAAILQRLKLWQDLCNDPQLATLVGIPPIPMGAPALPPGVPQGSQPPSNSGLPVPPPQTAKPSGLPKGAPEDLQASYQASGIPQ